MALLREQAPGSTTSRSSAEHRRAHRTRTFKGAKIIFNGGSSVIDCMLKNTSATGACVELPSLVGVPEEFTLLIAPDTTHRECRIAWKRGNRLGVAYIG